MANSFKTALRFAVNSPKLDQLIRDVKEVDRAAARKGVRDGIGDVTKGVTKEAKARVRKRTGALRKSIGRKTLSDKGRVVGIVKPRGGEKYRIQVRGGKRISAVRYAHLVEFGRAPVVAKKAKILADGTAGVGGLPGFGKVFGKKVRAAAPQPFMRPAWAAFEGRAAGMIEKRLRESVKRFWEKRRGRRGK